MRIAEQERDELDSSIDDRKREAGESEESGGTLYQCRVCRYKSDRRYNVLRHESRIHQKKIKRKCCGMKITNKGEWYEHCETVHPGKRLSTVTSKTKYKIFGNEDLKSLCDISDSDDKSDVSWSPIKRRSSERIRKLAKKQKVSSPPMDYEVHQDATETEEIPIKSEESRASTPNVLQEILTNNNNHSANVNNQAVTMCYSSDVSSSSIWSMENSENIDKFYQINPIIQRLPPKKKILQKFLNNKNQLNSSEKENIDPIVKRIVVKETTQVRIERQMEISWNEITERHRAYLSSFDFDRYKV